MHDEAHDSSLDALKFREEVLQKLTKLANRVDSSPSSLERTIAMNLDRHSAEVNQLKYDLHIAHSQHTAEMIAKLKAIVGIIE